MSNYADKLKSPKWQRKRLEIMKRDKFKCKKCGDEETTLNVHHKIYNKGVEPWEYKNSELVTLCEDCHTIIEDIRRKDKICGIEHTLEDFDDFSIYKTKLFNEYRMIFIYNDGIVLVGKYANSSRVGGFTLFNTDIPGIIHVLEKALRDE